MAGTEFSYMELVAADTAAELNSLLPCLRKHSRQPTRKECLKSVQRLPNESHVREKRSLNGYVRCEYLVPCNMPSKGAHAPPSTLSVPAE